MLDLYDLLEKVAPTKTNILITGESGTGKELVAKAIHYNSPRKDKPFVTLNCGAIPESLDRKRTFRPYERSVYRCHCNQKRIV